MVAIAEIQGERCALFRHIDILAIGHGLSHTVTLYHSITVCHCISRSVTVSHRLTFRHSLSLPLSVTSGSGHPFGRLFLPGLPAMPAMAATKGTETKGKRVSRRALHGSFLCRLRFLRARHSSLFSHLHPSSMEYNDVDERRVAPCLSPTEERYVDKRRTVSGLPQKLRQTSDPKRTQ